ncbi:MAG: SGNH/GDSL hydrolase family protein [Limosilactobacillus pontis]
MRTYLPIQLLPFAQRTGRWMLKEDRDSPVLYTTNLEATCVAESSVPTSLPLTSLTITHPRSQPGLRCRVDGQPWQRFAAQPGKFSLVLSPATHTIEIMTAGNTDLDAVWSGSQGFAIRSLAVDNGGTLMAAPARPVIDFIGDSITAGCWVAGRHAALDYRPENNYAATCADLLGADSVRIAYSAGGVLRPATGGVPVASSFLSQIDQDTCWTPNHPQLVVINLGVNDRRYPQAKFVDAYDRFIHQVVTTFPTASIDLMVPFSQHFRDQITTIGRRHQLRVIDTAGWCPSYIDGLHPDQTGTIIAGRRLAQAIAPDLGKKGIK